MNEVFKYYMLTGGKYKNQIVKRNIEDFDEYIYNKQNKTWEACNILLEYLLPYGDTFEMYEEISESVVKAIA